MRRTLVVAASIGVLGTCSAAAYSLAPSAPAACWISKDLVVQRVHGDWQVQACIFERVSRSGAVLDQAGFSRVGIVGTTQPWRPVKPRRIFQLPAEK